MKSRKGKELAKTLPRHGMAARKNRKEKLTTAWNPNNQGRVVNKIVRSVALGASYVFSAPYLGATNISFTLWMN